MKKYIIFTGVLFMPDGNAAAQRANAFTKIIKSLGYTPVIIGMKKNVFNEDILETQSINNGVYNYFMCYPNSTFLWIKTFYNYKSITKIINYLGIDNVYAVIAMDYFSPALYKIISYCKKNKIIFVADAVDWFAKSNYSFPKCLIKDIDTKIRMNYLYKKVDRMITISEYLFNYYNKYINKIVQIPGIVNQENPGIKKEIYVPNEILTLSFVGSPGVRCEKEKIDWLIKAICEINEKCIKVKLIIAGIDKKTLEDNRPDLTSIKEFDSSITCLGIINHKKCLELIEKSDFSVIIREDSLLSKAGFPTKLGESFACGTPVFVTPTSNISEFISDGYGAISKGCCYEDVRIKLQEITGYSDKTIKNMHNIVLSDNPLSYEKYIDNMKKVLS